MAVAVMLCYARSGGTVLNRCLGSLPNTVVLSEVSPLGGSKDHNSDVSLRTVQEQASHWYGISLKSEGFKEGVLEFESVCEKTGRKLIVRDWTFVNFGPCKENDFIPKNTLSVLDVLKPATQVKPFAFVRDPIDILLSMSRKMTISVEDFFSQYLKYVKQLVVHEVPIVKYEHFCENPERHMAIICDICGLEYSDEFKKYADFDQVKGDLQFEEKSRGVKQKALSILKRRRVPGILARRINKCTDMIEANKLMGYPVSYYEAEFEPERPNFLTYLRYLRKMK